MEEATQEQGAKPDIEKIRSDISRYHSSFGAVLLQRWSMDAQAVTLTKIHHAPTKLRELFQANRASGRQLYLINLAQHAVDLTGLFKGDVDPAHAPPDEARARLQMSPGDLHSTVEQLKVEIEQERRVTP